MNEQHQRDEALFDAALQLPSVERNAFLEKACAGDHQLRQRVESLLKAHEKTSGLLEQIPENKTSFLSVQPSEKPGDQIGRYKLLQQIGEGGCGVVYMAEQLEPVRRRVALKIIKLGMDTKQVIARFEAERQALALMDHPNIAKVLDAGATETGRPYFVMELVRGTKITDYCDEHNFSTRQRLDLFMQVCRAIQHAHQKGIIHRDIKPSNILVTLHDGEPMPMVIDFGIAKATGGLRLTDQTIFTAFEQFLGTPAYMSPEQAQLTNQDIDTRSDIYSLGVLLYELLTSKTPFETKELLQEGLEEMLRTIREKEPVRPSTRLSTMAAAALSTTANLRHTDVPKLIHLLRGDLDWIVMKALDKDRTRRYETANALAMDIQRHLNNEMVVACPPSWLYRFQKLVHRNKLAFAAGAALAVALVIGLAVSAWLLVREKQAHERAVAAEQVTEIARAEEFKLRQRAELGEKMAVRNALAARQNLYASEMSSVQQALAQQNLGRARDLLRAHEPRLGEPDLRGWEWWYYSKQCLGDEVFTLRTAGKKVTSLVSSVHLRGVVAGWEDGTVELWDLAAHRPMGQLLKESDAIHYMVSDTEGRFLTTLTVKGPVKLWDVSDLSNMKLLRTFPTNYVQSLSGRNRLVAVTAVSGELWHVPDGDFGLVGVCNWETGESLRILPESGDAGVFSDDGGLLATGSWKGTVKIWRVGDWTLQHTLEPAGRVISMAFSPDGRRLATSNWEGAVLLWDVASGRQIGAFKGHSSRVCPVRFSPDGQMLATPSADQTIGLWDVSTQSQLVRLKGHERDVQDAAFSPDGKWLASARSGDGTMRIWKVDPSSHTNLAMRGFSPPVIARDSRTAASANERGQVDLWDLETKQVTATLPSEPNPVGFTSDGKLLITATVAKPLPFYSNPIAGLKFWDVGSQTLNHVVEFSPSNQIVSAASLSPDGLTLATGDPNGNVILWEVKVGKIAKTLSAGSVQIWNLVFTADGKTLAIALQNEIKLWNLATGAQTSVAGGGTPVAFSPDGSIVATGYFNEVKLWRTATGEELQTIRGHREQIMWLAFSKDGRSLASAGEEIKVWNLATGRELASFLPNSASVFVSFSPDGKRLMGGRMGEAYIWSAASEDELFRPSDARANLLRSQIRARDQKATSNLIDLSAYYNVALTESWHPGGGTNDLAELPQGIQTFAGVQFDVRGLIQLGSETRTGERYARRIFGIAAGVVCQRLDFLHSAITAFDKEGTHIGSYIVHYADGQTREIPIVLGRDVADWWSQPNESKKEFTIAWTGANEASRQEGQTIRIFKTTWKNPIPDVVITSIDFVWRGTDTAPFLVAITAD